jgi:tetratricopeptide (TPR) repeat protein
MKILTRNKFLDSSKTFIYITIIFLIFLCGPVWSETEGPLKLPKVEGSKSFDLEISQINRLAIKKYQQGLYEMAAVHFKKAVNLAQQLRDPSQGILYFNLALSLHKLGDHEQATKQFYSARQFARGNLKILESKFLKTHEQ